MKLLFTFTMLALYSLSASGQTSLMLEGYGGSPTASQLDPYAVSNTTSSNGKIIVTGNAEADDPVNPAPYMATFDYNATQVPSDSVNNFFIAVYDNSGTPETIRFIGVSNNMTGTDVATDQSNNIYVAGNLKGDALIDGLVHSSQTSAVSNPFLMKMDMAGNIAWTKVFPSGGTVGVEGITIDPSGNIYLAGLMQYPGDSVMFDNIAVPMQGFGATFIAKLDANGDAIWAHSVAYSEFHDITNDADGNVYITGKFSSSTFGSISLTASGLYDVLITKISPSGNYIWARQAGSSDNSSFAGDRGNAIVVQGDQLHIAGSYSGAAIFEGDTLPAGYGFFVAKYDTAGNYQWVRGNVPLTAGYKAYGDAMAVDPDGNLYLGGQSSGDYTYFSPTDSIEFGYIAKYDPNGTFQWVTEASKDVFDLATTSAGDIAAVGEYNDYDYPYVAGDSLVATFTLHNYITVIDGAGTAPVGLNDFLNNSQLLVYPNPSTGIFTIDADETLLGQTAILYNALGTKVLQLNICEKRTQVRSSLNTGIYFLKIHNSTRKIIIQ